MPDTTHSAPTETAPIADDTTPALALRLAAALRSKAFAPTDLAAIVEAFAALTHVVVGAKVEAIARGKIEAIARYVDSLREHVDSECRELKAAAIEAANKLELSAEVIAGLAARIERLERRAPESRAGDGGAI